MCALKLVDESLHDHIKVDEQLKGLRTLLIRRCIKETIGCIKDHFLLSITAGVFMHKNNCIIYMLYAFSIEKH